MKPPIILFIVSAVHALNAATYHVDGSDRGSDGNPGTAEKPWMTALKAFSSAEPGDTVVFRRGVYRLPRPVLTSDFKLDATRTGAVIFKAATDEAVTITVMKPVPAGAWKQIASTKAGQPIFAAPSGEDGRVANLTENGNPLERPFPIDPRYPHADSLPEVITGPGQWAASLADHRVMVCTTDGKPPADRIEVCDVRGGDGGANLFDLQRDPQDRCRGLHIVFDHLTLEGGNFGFTIRTGFVEFRHCVLRKSFADLINTLSGRILVEDCDFSAFGESAIDVTTAGDGPKPEQTPPMAIRGSRFHHNALVRSPQPRLKGYNAVMLKGGSTDVVVENNEFHDLRVTLSVLTLGGSTAGGSIREGTRLLARKNRFHDISGDCVVVFASSEDCQLLENQLFDCQVDDLITLIRVGSTTRTGNLRPAVLNNLFVRNQTKHTLLSVSPKDAADGLVFDGNFVEQSGDNCRINDALVQLKNLAAQGFQKRPPSLEAVRAAKTLPAKPSTAP